MFLYNRVIISAFCCFAGHLGLRRVWWDWLMRSISIIYWTTSLDSEDEKPAGQTIWPIEIKCNETSKRRFIKLDTWHCLRSIINSTRFTIGLGRGSGIVRCLLLSQRRESISVIKYLDFVQYFDESRFNDPVLEFCLSALLWALIYEVRVWSLSRETACKRHCQPEFPIHVRSTCSQQWHPECTASYEMVPLRKSQPPTNDALLRSARVVSSF